MKNLIEMTFSTNSLLVTKLLNELFQQISSKSTIKLNEYQFEIPQNSKRLPPILNLQSLEDFKQDHITIALYQVYT
ncbi:unnamed protein product [Adineta steineri]|uniref:Uncharacterized protein n=1 Tax=Adineta steineri TaxID=433720 RepID=A0A814LLL6_9BILA|nr:unnamed protein product [Adineta steineri]CAF1249902.1 unnamed protein product [Adineta steineri]CAF1382144.1 unnamed protein product [Adineta steineri]